ncbi:putative zinc finger protein [Danaus plexippus plexippus]|uniref:Zinc finger protein n=1 Tax=Danaus plexippus plexippus TaxID=278856 RepID=A0A212ELM4_DANPL|nr:putative zinc finger protein [Danaus plexippus plexippus]
MTRFARAKGSKASNLKAPEDSTPWEVMKEQMEKAKREGEEVKKREEAEQQRVENYNNFLKEHKAQKRKATWCDFPEAEKKKNSNENLSEVKTKKTKKDKNLASNTEATVNSNENTLNNTAVSGELTETGKKKKNKNKNNKNKQASEGNNQEENRSSNEDSRKEVKDNAHNINSQNEKTSINNNKPVPAKKIKKKLKKGEQPARRKPIDDRSFQIIINGKEVELIRFDGFPVMKKDAERLEELKKSMIQKGIPKSEVQRTMKLERRRAEKALARVKREVCYNCRKGGHNLSDCPDLKSHIPGVDSAEGVCFKCGSTEHRQFECKVQKDKEFRFATCFICREPGHIARQCPDNPKGLYPNGGSCKLCGDVTHLRKDCPTMNEKKESTSIKLPTLNDSNIEDIDSQAKTVTTEVTKKPKKIRF